MRRENDNVLNFLISKIYFSNKVTVNKLHLKEHILRIKNVLKSIYKFNNTVKYNC